MDPRIRRSRAKILAAAGDLIVERGIPGASIEQIAARSGVAKTTIYRQWPTRMALLVDAIAAEAPPMPGPEARTDIVTYLCAVADVFGERALALVSAVGAARRTDPEFAEVDLDFLRGRQEVLREMLVARGHEDPETLIAALGGAVFYWRLVAGRTVDRAAVTALVARVLPDEL